MHAWVEKARQEDGFTLVELLIVIAIIGVLAAIAIPIFLSQQDKADSAARLSEASSAYSMLLTAATADPDCVTDFANNTGAMLMGAGTELCGVGSLSPSHDVGVYYDPIDPTTACVEVWSHDYGLVTAKSAAGIKEEPCNGWGGGWLALDYDLFWEVNGSTPWSLPVTVYGDGYSAPYTFSLTCSDGGSGACTGITVNSSTGELSGPAFTGSADLEVSVVDAGGLSGMTSFTVSGFGGGGSGPSGSLGVNYLDYPADITLPWTMAPSVSGVDYTLPLTYSLTCTQNNGSGECGDISIDTGTGVISGGAFSTTGNVTLDVSVSDSSGSPLTAGTSFMVNFPTMNTVNVTNGALGSPWTFGITLNGGWPTSGPYTYAYSIIAGDGTGTSIDAGTGVISGPSYDPGIIIEYTINGPGGFTWTTTRTVDGDPA